MCKCTSCAGTGERGNVSMPARWIRPGWEDGAILPRGVTCGEGRRGHDRTWQLWGVSSTQEKGRRDLLQGVDMGNWQRQASIQRYLQVPVSNTGDDEDRRRYHHLEGDGEEDDWVRAEPCRKRADWTTHPVKQMELDGRCFRCLTRGHHTKECRDPLVCYICRGVGSWQWVCPQGTLEENRHRSHTTEAVGPKIPQRQGANKEEKGETETIRSTLMGCLIGEITRGSPRVKDSGRSRRRVTGQRCRSSKKTISSFGGSQWHCIYKSRDRHKELTGRVKLIGGALS